MSTLNAIGEEAYRNATNKGFVPLAPTDLYTELPERSSLVPTRLALIHSEVSEALEEVRKPHPDRGLFANELADIVIRTCELASSMGIDLDRVVDVKQAANRARPRKHGGKRF